MPEDQPYANPADLQFGQAAQEKQEKVDELEARGEADDLPEDDDATRPRAGNKAEPEDAGN